MTKAQLFRILNDVPDDCEIFVDHGEAEPALIDSIRLETNAENELTVTLQL